MIYEVFVVLVSVECHDIFNSDGAFWIDPPEIGFAVGLLCAFFRYGGRCYNLVY